VRDVDAPNERADAIRQVQRTAAALVARLKPLASIKVGSASASRDLERALDGLGEPETFSRALADLSNQASEIVKESRRRRADELRAALAAYLRQAGREDARETAVGWRIGRIELEVRVEEGTLRSLYNREPLSAWTAVSEPAHVEACLRDAEKLLDAAEIPIDALAPALISAYDFLAARTDGLNLGSRRVALKDLLEEVQVVLARDAIKARKPRAAEAAVRMPLWALLYNADLYRASANEAPAGDRLMFESGSTNETKRIGLTLNGLEAGRDYQRLCFVRRIAGS
jgi:hypothetical protein